MKLVSRRSFLKLAGVTALAVAGASVLSSCGASQILMPLQFESNEIGSVFADVLNKANLKVVYSENTDILYPQIMAAVQSAVPKYPELEGFDPSRYAIQKTELKQDGLDGTEHTILYVTFTLDTMV